MISMTSVMRLKIDNFLVSSFLGYVLRRSKVSLERHYDSTTLEYGKNVMGRYL